LPPGRRGARSAIGRASYLFNATIAGIEQADGCMIIGANPRRKRRCSMRASASAGAPRT
jgi:NADH dehydrogenase/NADH:ubiquinone oxidoreductase subunit G